MALDANGVGSVITCVLRATASDTGCISFASDPQGAAGKIALLIYMTGRAEFESGFSAGCGLTKECVKFMEGVLTYVDTPGLVDTKGRAHAAQTLCELLSANTRCKIIFVTTLEAGSVRPEDQATMGLVVEALLEAKIGHKAAGVKFIFTD